MKKLVLLFTIIAAGLTATAQIQSPNNNGIAAIAVMQEAVVDAPPPASFSNIEEEPRSLRPVFCVRNNPIRNNLISIDINQSNTGGFTVYSMTGNVITFGSFENGMVAVNTSGWVPGIYVVNIVTPTGSYSIRIVVP